MLKSQPDDTVAVLIPASGLSERMGIAKALLEYSPGFTFIEKIIETYTRAGCTRIISTVNPLTLSSVRQLRRISPAQLVLNQHPELGRLHSVKLGLEMLKDVSFCFIQNIDNPFVTTETILHIFKERDPGVWISPEFLGRGGHPVLLHQTLIHQILEQTREDISLKEILRNFPKKSVEIQDDTVLQNINTPKEYKKYLEKSLNFPGANSSHQ